MCADATDVKCDSSVVLFFPRVEGRGRLNSNRIGSTDAVVVMEKKNRFRTVACKYKMRAKKHLNFRLRAHFGSGRDIFKPFDGPRCAHTIKTFQTFYRINLGLWFYGAIIITRAHRYVQNDIPSRKPARRGSFR